MIGSAGPSRRATGALALLAMSGVVGLAACGSSSSGAPSSSGNGGGSAKAGSPFIVVIDTGTSGPYAQNGQAAVAGVKSAAAVLNKSGGILGHPVQVEVLDNGGNPTTAASKLAQRLSSGTLPNLVEPGSISTEGVAEVPIANAHKVLSIGTPNDSSLNDPKKYPYEFLIAPNASLPATSVMEYAKSKGWTKLAMISSSDAYGASVAKATTDAAKAAGITLSTATYNDTDLDVTAQLQQLKSHNPDALFMQSFGSPAGVILAGRQKLQWNIPLVGDLTTATTPLIWDQGGSSSEQGMVVQTNTVNQYSASPPAAQTAFIAALKQQGTINSVLTTTSYQYDSVMVVAQAAKQANSIDSGAMAKALENLQQPADPPWVTLKTYVFSATDHSPAAATSNWIFIPPTKLTDGQYGAPGS
jgi:branched-chain amino acid transport system substrate-binding protein